MTSMILKSPQGDLPLHPSLHFVNDIEQRAGNLFKIAHMLIEGDMSAKDAMFILKHIYQHAGYTGSTEELTTFLIAGKSGFTPMVQLMNILTTILKPLYHIGAITPVGKTTTTRKQA